ncbi:MAG: vanadium-dependent haloperoxidase [Cyanobacteria bacterium P01_F01_bin.33]
MMSREQQAQNVRANANQFAASRPRPVHLNNTEEFDYRRGNNRPSHIANFTKGLPHDKYGLLQDDRDYQQFVVAIDSGDPRDFTPIRLGPGPFTPEGSYANFTPEGNPIHDWAAASNQDSSTPVRAWESQGAGSTFDLEGPDAQALTMPPAPRLDSQELWAEMAEVYWMAVLRDVSFSNYFSAPMPDVLVKDAQVSLARFAWFDEARTDELTESDLAPEALQRRRAIANNGVDVPLNQLFRGVTRGDDVGPYISQFLLIGNTGVNSNDSCRELSEGLITYGSIRIDQKVRLAKPEIDYMTQWDEWLDVQNGADVRGQEVYCNGVSHEEELAAKAKDEICACSDKYRFITTPRDLATYVHYDALYEAYLNACLILLGMGAPFDPGIPFQDKDFRDKQQGFAQFGGPHILSLVTEVATRALKAVRYQKFNVHRRLRPEALGGLVEQFDVLNKKQGDPSFDAADAEALASLDVAEGLLQQLEADYKPSVSLASQIRPKAQNSLLLPMAFPEGSPMHPSYGAGHATVAGACVTILKAFFDHGWQLKDKDGNPIAFESDEATNGQHLKSVASSLTEPLTVEGELNKLASNISIGRDWAGVHYFSDYIESLRLGEQIAIGILQEQKLTYGENFSMTVPLYDGGTMRI